MTDKLNKFLVGGAVRDELLGREIHDKDYVIVGSTIEEMLSLGYKQVGNDFPVFLHPQTGEEYALARKEMSTGNKYTDFEFDFNPNTTLKEDLIRRDLTINSLSKDVKTNEIIDYFGGLQDIQNKILRHVSEHFVEDPLRILRLIRFHCQLPQFSIAQETKELCKQMIHKGMLNALTKERVWKEIEKALQTPHFYIFLQDLEELDGLQEIFPEIYSLKEVPERLEYHPEGNAYKHLILCFQQVNQQKDCKQLLQVEGCKKGIALINFGLLCHDLGKNLTQESWPSHKQHEILGLDLVDNLCNRLKVPNEYKHFARISCKHHMRFYKFLDMQVKNQYDMVKEITNFKDEKTLRYLLNVHACDLFGRQGTIDVKRIKTYEDVVLLVTRIYTIMENVSLKCLPKATQNHLKNFKGEQFGKLYRDAMISYLKYHLQKLK